VKINIHEQLYAWRQEVASEHLLGAVKSTSMSVMAKIMSNATLYRAVGKVARWSLDNLPRALIYNPLNVWGKGRELPEPPAHSFNEWYRKNRKQ
jgi:L-lactate dehydrogenase complex protein LldF